MSLSTFFTSLLGLPAKQPALPMPTMSDLIRPLRPEDELKLAIRDYVRKTGPLPKLMPEDLPASEVADMDLINDLAQTRP